MDIGRRFGVAFFVSDLSELALGSLVLDDALDFAFVYFFVAVFIVRNPRNDDIPAIVFECGSVLSIFDLIDSSLSAFVPFEFDEYGRQAAVGEWNEGNIDESLPRWEFAEDEEIFSRRVTRIHDGASECVF